MGCCSCWPIAGMDATTNTSIIVEIFLVDSIFDLGPTSGAIEIERQQVF